MDDREILKTELMKLLDDIPLFCLNASMKIIWLENYPTSVSPKCPSGMRPSKQSWQRK